MAIDAKMSFLRQLEAKSAEEMTMADIQRMMVIVSDVLEGFDMRERNAWEDEGTDQLLKPWHCQRVNTMWQWLMASVQQRLKACSRVAQRLLRNQQWCCISCRTEA